MYSRFNARITYFSLVALLLCVASLCSGGNAPSRTYASDFKEKIQKELEKIREYSPKVKLEKLWLKEFRQAKRARKEALMESAEVFSKDEFNHGEYLLNLSRNYAKKRQFRKAEYLARKATESFVTASKKAKKNLAQAIEERAMALKKLEQEINMLPRAKAPRAIHSLRLKLIMLRDALRAQDFVAFDNLKAGLEKEINTLNGRSHDGWPDSQQGD